MYGSRIGMVATSHLQLEPKSFFDSKFHVEEICGRARGDTAGRQTTQKQHKYTPPKASVAETNEPVDRKKKVSPKLFRGRWTFDRDANPGP
jgi:hypothetical protein